MTIPFNRSRPRPIVTPAEIAEAELLRLWILSMAPGRPLPPTSGER